MRTNAAAAKKFCGLIDEGDIVAAEPSTPSVNKPKNTLFAPVDVTIACTNMCGQRCVYCYGTPAHQNKSLIDPDFCRAAMHYMANNAPSDTKILRTSFHGVGEPILNWPLFTKCVNIVRKVAQEHAIVVHICLCTGGQVDRLKAEWIAEHIDELNLSLDGPSDIQNQQRPRRDGRDSFIGPLMLAKCFHRTGKSLHIKSTITSVSVSRMIEIVDFVASDIGSVSLHLGMVFTPEWVDREKVSSPPLKDYVKGFGKALVHGLKKGVKVEHPSVSLDHFIAPHENPSETHFCLAPPNLVTAYYDVPEEGVSDPQHGVYGWYDKPENKLRFDHKKRATLKTDKLLDKCQTCPCSIGCLGRSGVKGRMPKNEIVGGPKCQARIGVLKELIRQVVPKRKIEEKVI
jgi:sulfatase maturation enzyme AslB (radical SAM superfamily)